MMETTERVNTRSSAPCLTINEVLKMIGRVSGRRPQIMADSAQKGDMRHSYADTWLVRTDLGFAPTVTLEDSLAAEYNWLAEILRDPDQ